MTYDHFVITGSGRSGTRYAAELLTAAGLPCAHQKVYHERSDLRAFNVAWGPYIGDSTAFAAPFVKELQNTLVIHQVRDPRLTIPSLIHNRHVIGQNSTNKGLEFLARHISVGGIPDLIERAAAQWVAWNLLVEKIADQENYVFWRLEDYDLGRLSLLERWLDLSWEPMKPTWAFQNQSKTTGSNGSTEPLDLGQIENPEFHAMVERYGYGG